MYDCTCILYQDPMQENWEWMEDASMRRRESLRLGCWLPAAACLTPAILARANRRLPTPVEQQPPFT
jgi:hypothetical protein